MLHKHYLAQLVSPTLFLICSKIKRFVCDAIMLFPIQKKKISLPFLSRSLSLRGGAALSPTHCWLHAAHKKTLLLMTMKERTERSKAWLHFIRVGADNAPWHKGNKSFALKGSNASRLLKYPVKGRDIQHMLKALHSLPRLCYKC